ncbi:Pleiotropic drug resistance protein 1 [Camellia lanceoleosa]|uniref:Pleiotropic drug resistance protein 1 n=1 Tax=Camellia lanceoleosa TaxID=1840588 RepID=A0ACC0FIB9_9ERIC|nr:Pleiotropic drug resistance protein 1 [Camellia lanceoleosa]
MEGGDNILRVSSARLSSSNIWRNSGREVFSKSFHDEDDEDALKWAALEKLPTYQRIQRGILTEEQGHAREIDIKNLGVMERKNLLERLVKIAEDDNEKFLLKLKKRIDRVGIDLPTIEVRFEHLNVDAEAYVGGRALPTILNFSINLFEGFLNYLHVLPSRKKPLSILHDVSGIIKPGRMTLLLGPPSSGKTSLLLALGGKLDSDLKAVSLEGQRANVVTDYVLKVTSKKDQEQYWAKRDEPYNFVTVNEFAEAFLSFHVGRKLGDELGVPFDKAKSHPAALTTKKYGVSKKELLKALVSREYLLMKRNSFVYIFKFTQLIIMAFIAMTIFLRTEMPKKTTADGTIFMGALFYSIMMVMFNGFAELAMTILKLPTFYKQRDLLFFPAWAYSLPTWILKIPITFLEVGIWVFTTYYVIGFDPNVGRLFKMYLLLLFINQMASGMFRLIGALGRNMIVANTFGSFALLGVLVLGGFILSRENIKKWWIWGYWASPLMYAQNAIAVNEFLGSSWRHVPANSTESLGVIVLKSRGIFPEAYWYWIGVGASIGYIFLFNSLFTLALAYLNPFGKPQAILTEETMAERNACKTKEIELSSREKRLSERGDEVQRSASSTSVTSRVGSISEVSQNRKRGMVLPFEPLSITIDDVRYHDRYATGIFEYMDSQEMKAQGIPEDRLELLKGVSGAFRPGVLTALMGVSGAGKTTLMDVLAGRKTGGYIEGRITISGYPKKQETFARVAGYCEQTDIHSPHVTVYESLQYSAWLRLPPDVDSASKKMFVDEVMELVELTPLKEALVGLPGVNGLSTEQRKRLTIAVELVANPSIIFMDEPTSGLDARAAAIVMRTVRNTVDTGRTVVCTIHQPSIDIFDAFDEVGNFYKIDDPMI